MSSTAEPLGAEPFSRDKRNRDTAPVKAEDKPYKKRASSAFIYGEHLPPRAVQTDADGADEPDYVARAQPCVAQTPSCRHRPRGAVGYLTAG